ncbi:FecR family protein [Ruegeria sp.]|uniref:FecR family protein n=1 Tax=Ruegeria sp. TaxID=1879320 RepID=UPI003C7BFB7E
MMALPEVAAATIGKVLSVQQGAEVIRAGKTSRVREGMEIASGDTITTNSSGVVQLLFADETKIAVGPNATMVLDVSMLRGKRRAKSFGVQALGGSFRFISGNSRKRAYSVKTPTATMAVRGTIFDLWIASDTQSAMLVLEGTVQMCGQSGRCRSTRRQCSMFATSSGGGVGQPVDRDQYTKAIASGFPFIESESQLLPPFQAGGEGCARETAVVAPPPRVEPERPEVQQARAAEPPEPAPPEVEPPEPDDEPVDDGPVDDGPVDDGPVDDGPVDDGPVDDGPTDDGPAEDLDDGPNEEPDDGPDAGLDDGPQEEQDG